MGSVRSFSKTSVKNIGVAERDNIQGGGGVAVVLQIECERLIHRPCGHDSFPSIVIFVLFFVCRLPCHENVTVQNGPVL